MFKIIFTLDYEIHGNGDGDPYKLMVEPTDRLLKLFNKYGAKLTIMVDVAEILKFRDHKVSQGSDDYHYAEIEQQLQNAIITGHDVQMHIHSGYFNSELVNNKWKQKWDEYDLSSMDYKKIYDRIQTCKIHLEKLINKKSANYECNVFRAANWSMIPSKNITKALIDNGFKVDTSVFKYGKRSNRVKFDYSKAYSNILPWYTKKDDICIKDNNGQLLEIPIYCENRNFLAFITYIRAYRMIRARFHKHEKYENKSEQSMDINDTAIKKVVRKNKIKRILAPFTKKHAWKLDFNQSSGKQLINAVKRIERQYSNSEVDIPVVLIGHSKSFIKYNERTLEPFLKFISKNSDKFEFSVFNDLEFSDYRN